MNQPVAARPARDTLAFVLWLIAAAAVVAMFISAFLILGGSPGHQITVGKVVAGIMAGAVALAIVVIIGIRRVF
jgi:hypothetical protein